MAVFASTLHSTLIILMAPNFPGFPNKMIGWDPRSVVLHTQFSDYTHREETGRGNERVLASNTQHATRERNSSYQGGRLYRNALSSSQISRTMLKIVVC
jgi:hypothetical protein